MWNWGLGIGGGGVVGRVIIAIPFRYIDVCRVRPELTASPKMGCVIHGLVVDWVCSLVIGHYIILLLTTTIHC